MKNLIDRFLKYVSYDTQSLDTTGTHPSTAKQLVLAELLAKELQELGCTGVAVSEHGYVTGELPAVPGLENSPAMGLISHMDTSDGAPGDHVNPRLVVYDGEDIRLGTSGLRLDAEQFPVLKRMVGQTLIVTDGTTLLGADDKAGIAEIMTAVQFLQEKKLPHGRICIAFTPDEEIGEGTMFFDVEKFGAEFAFTVDGGDVTEIECENFNAASAEVEFSGINVHPGSARGIMKNAQKILFAFADALPSDASPENTEGRQGFFHIVRMNGSVDAAHMTLLIRDHDLEKFQQKKELLLKIRDDLNLRYGAESVKVSIRDQYRNMKEIIDRHPQLVKIAEEAVRAEGLEPVIQPIRGGTDGAMLSFRGLPCPNLGTGGYNYHGKQEFAVVEEMETAVRIILNIVDITRKTDWKAEIMTE